MHDNLHTEVASGEGAPIPSAACQLFVRPGCTPAASMLHDYTACIQDAIFKHSHLNKHAYRQLHDDIVSFRHPQNCFHCSHAGEVCCCCRMTRVAAKKASPGSSAAAARCRNDFVATPSGSVAYSNGPSNRMLSGSDYRCEQSMTIVLLLNVVSEKNKADCACFSASHQLILMLFLFCVMLQRCTMCLGKS